MEIEHKLVERPIFSVCIPQHNRTSFVIEACRSLADQTFKDFEVCISDDCSTDGREAELLDFLEKSGLSFVYRRQVQNSRYDANLRASIGLASGKFCFLLGNDDCLASAAMLEDIYADIQGFDEVGVVITNYGDFATGKEVKRIKRTGIIGEGPYIAASNFRNFSFVSGILLDTARAQKHATAKWDGSEMYQMFIGSRIIAEGGRLLGIERVTIRKDIQIPGERVDNFALRPRLDPCPIVERRLPMGVIGRLMADAVGPYLSSAAKPSVVEQIFRQIFVFTYPFWILEYRRVQSWKYALGVCLGMRPRNTVHGLGLGRSQRFRLFMLYGIASILGLITPHRAFDSMYPILHSLAKSYSGG